MSFKGVNSVERDNSVLKIRKSKNPEHYFSNPKSKLCCRLVKSDKAKSFKETIQSIFNEILTNSNGEFPLKISFFTGCSSKIDYKDKLTIILSEKEKRNLYCPVTLISQPPASDEEIIAEVFMIQNFDKNYSFKIDKDFLRIKRKGIEILIAAVPAFEENSFEENVKTSFKKLNIIFEKSGFTFSNVIRQWNYIEDILEQSIEDKYLKQHYQIFNNYRGLNYQPCIFDNGYPVATGIGVSHGSVCIEIVAVKGKDLNIMPIHNSRQIDAHSYSENVLIGKPILNLTKNAAPKFERAKIFETPEFSILLVSGTAAIIGENTVCIDDVVGQTKTTIENINILINEAKKLRNSRIELLNYRVYIKNKEDFERVQEICLNEYANAPGVFLISDICRVNLLVEIECNYFIWNLDNEVEIK